MPSKVIEQLVKILIPLGALALIIGALVATEKTFAAFMAFLVILYGIWSVADPEAAFMFGRRWYFKRAEPSELALLLTQIGGIGVIISGIILLIVVLLKL
jgi:hypothetical protein